MEEQQLTCLKRDAVKEKNMKKQHKTTVKNGGLTWFNHTEMGW